MTDSVVALFKTSDTPEWNSLAGESGISSILHSRDFLGYHGERFVDRSLTIRDSGGRLTGIFPAAQSKDDAKAVISHPGATFGGLLTTPDVTGAAFENMMARATAFWAGMGYRVLAYKAVPFIYHAVPRQEDTYVLWRLGARLSRRTLSACIDLAGRLSSSSRRNRSLAKARRSGCTVRAGYDVLGHFWPVVESSLLERHGVRPVHSLAEIQYLAHRFESNIECLGAFIDDELVAGAVLFTSQTAAHVQYSLSSPRGLSIGAMDLLMDHAISASASHAVRYFDLGISTDPSGRELNESLHQFKMEFGAGTVVYDQYELALGAHS